MDDYDSLYTKYIQSESESKQLYQTVKKLEEQMEKQKKDSQIELDKLKL